MNELEFIKDKPLDVSSKFLGSYGGERSKPWYLKSKREIEEEKLRERREKKQKEKGEIQSVKKSTSIVTKEVFEK